MTKKERLQDVIITGLLRRDTSGPCDMTDEAVEELDMLWATEEGTAMLQLYWNSLSCELPLDRGPIGWATVNEIFEEFVYHYPNITKTLTIYVYG